MHPGPDQLTKLMTNVYVIQHQSNKTNTNILLIDTKKPINNQNLIE